MTPLAHRIARQITLPPVARSFDDRCDLQSRFWDVHCFECTDVLEAAGDLGVEMINKGVCLDALSFLPAPRTWLEWRYSDGSREGVLLIEDGRNALCFLAGMRGESIASHRVIGRLLLAPESWNADFPTPIDIDTDSESRKKGWCASLYGLLAMINTPRVIGRQQHMPHRGLERRLLRSHGNIGRFPLQAWTEIKLDVTPPVDASADPSIEAHYTGKRALHFCRAHLRIRMGQLEFVNAHWRGDPSLGIKRSRYKLEGAPT